MAERGMISKYLKTSGKSSFQIDLEKIKSKACFDGKWVLRTSLEDLPADQVALKYKQPWKDIILDLDRLEEVEIEQDGTCFAMHTQCEGVYGKVFQAGNVALPAILRRIDPAGS